MICEEFKIYFRKLANLIQLQATLPPFNASFNALRWRMREIAWQTVWLSPTEGVLIPYERHASPP